MASLKMRLLSDKIKSQLLSAVGDIGFRDHLNRGMCSYQDFSLSAAELDTLNASPKTILAAPGSGLVNLVDSILCFVDAGGTQLTSVAIEFRYTNGSGVKVTADLPAAQVNSATDTYYYARGASGVPVVNAVVVAVAASDITAGTGVIYGRIIYRTVKISELA